MTEPSLRRTDDVDFMDSFQNDMDLERRHKISRIKQVTFRTKKKNSHEDFEQVDDD